MAFWSNWTGADWGSAISGLADIGGMGLSFMAQSEAGRAADRSSQAAMGVAAASEKLGEKQMQLARDQWNRYLNIFGGLEEAQVKEAKADIARYRPLKNKMLGEAKKELAWLSPLKKEQIGDARRDVAAMRPLKDAGLGLQLDNIKRTKKLYFPAEDEYLAAAREGLDPESMANARELGVRAAFDQMRERSAMDRRSRGATWSAPMRQAMTRRDDIAEALGVADARFRAKREAEDAGFERLGAALGKRSTPYVPMQGRYDTGSATVPAAYEAPSGYGLAQIAQGGMSGAGTQLARSAGVHTSLADTASQNQAGAMQALGIFSQRGLSSLQDYLGRR